MADHLEDVSTSAIASETYSVIKGCTCFNGITVEPRRDIISVADISRVLLLESVEDVGVRFAPLSKYVESYDENGRYNGQLVIARRDGCNEEIAAGVARFGADQLTIPYNKEEIAEVLARVTLKIGRVNRLHEFICSELVNDCFGAAVCRSHVT